MNCLACGSQTSLKYAKNLDFARVNRTSYSSRKRPELMHYDYFECNNCKTLSSPRDAAVGLLGRYGESAHESELESRFAAATYVNLVKKHLPTFPASVLDIGCSDGAFLSAMADAGASHLEGVEPSRIAAALATDPRLTIHVKGFEDFSSQSRFDLITIFQTIEHLADPHATLNRARDLCSERGHVMIVCHDRLSAVNRLLQKRSPIFDLEHLQIFTQAGLRAFFDSQGFQIRMMRRFTNKYSLSYVLRLAGIQVAPNSAATRLVVPVPAGNVVLFAQSRSDPTR